MKALVLEGQKIVLRPLLPSDAEAVYQNINDRRVVRYLPRVPWPYHRRDAVKFIARTQRERRKGASIVLAIVLKDKQRFIGTVGVKNIDTRHRHAELGYWVGRRYWGKGYMTEAVTLVLQFAFERKNCTASTPACSTQIRPPLGCLRSVAVSAKASCAKSGFGSDAGTTW